MRAFLLASMAAVALVSAGCADDFATPDPADTVSTAISSLAKGNGKKVCSRMTVAAQKQVLTLLADNPLGFPDIEARTCVEGIEKLHAALSPAQRNILVDGEVGDAKIKGDKATVRVIGVGMVANLQKFDEKWLITGGLFNYAGRTVGS